MSSSFTVVVIIEAASQEEAESQFADMAIEDLVDVDCEPFDDDSEESK